jgi:hypothetical protein
MGNLSMEGFSLKKDEQVLFMIYVLYKYIEKNTDKEYTKLITRVIETHNGNNFEELFINYLNICNVFSFIKVSNEETFLNNFFLLSPKNQAYVILSIDKLPENNDLYRIVNEILNFYENDDNIILFMKHNKENLKQVLRVS